MEGEAEKGAAEDVAAVMLTVLVVMAAVMEVEWVADMEEMAVMEVNICYSEVDTFLFL